MQEDISQWTFHHDHKAWVYLLPLIYALAITLAFLNDGIDWAKIHTVINLMFLGKSMHGAMDAQLWSVYIDDDHVQLTVANGVEMHMNYCVDQDSLIAVTLL